MSTPGAPGSGGRAGAAPAPQKPGRARGGRREPPAGSGPKGRSVVSHPAPPRSRFPVGPGIFGPSRKGSGAGGIRALPGKAPGPGGGPARPPGEPKHHAGTPPPHPPRRARATLPPLPGATGGSSRPGPDPRPAAAYAGTGTGPRATGPAVPALQPPEPHRYRTQRRGSRAPARPRSGLTGSGGTAEAARPEPARPRGRSFRGRRGPSRPRGPPGGAVCTPAPPARCSPPRPPYADGPRGAGRSVLPGAAISRGK